MKGNNTLILNESTMKEVVQHWLNTVVLREGDRIRVDVASVRPAKTGGPDNTFEIRLSEPDTASKD